MNEFTVVLNSEEVPTENRVMTGNLFAGVVGEGIGEGIEEGLKVSCAIAGNFSLKSLLSFRAQLTKLLSKIDEEISHEAFNSAVGLCVAIPIPLRDLEEQGCDCPTSKPLFESGENEMGDC